MFMNLQTYDFKVMAAVFVRQQIHIRAYVLWYKKRVKFINSVFITSRSTF